MAFVGYAGFNEMIFLTVANGISIQDYMSNLWSLFLCCGYCNVTLCSYKGDINGKFAEEFVDQILLLL